MTQPTQRGPEPKSAVELIQEALNDAVALGEHAAKITPELAVFASERFVHLLGGALRQLRSEADDGR